MGYLLVQIFLCLLLALLLGLLVGWLLWGRRTDAAHDDGTRALDAARRRIAALEADLAAARSEPPATAGLTTSPPTPSDADAGDVDHLGTPTGTSADDLTRIDGIGPVIERQLASIGVTTFAQIARFTADDVARVHEAIGVVPDRIEREDWIGQAARLHRENTGDDA